MLEIKNRKTQILYLEKNAITHSIERIDVPIYIHRFDIGNIEEKIYIAEGKCIIGRIECPHIHPPIQY